MATNNTVLWIKFATIMTRPKKLSLTFWHPNSMNIGWNILIAYLQVNKGLSWRPLKTVARYIGFEYKLCAVVYICMESIRMCHCLKPFYYNLEYPYPVSFNKLTCHFFFNQLTYADFLLYETLDCCEYFHSATTDQYPNIGNYIDRFRVRSTWPMNYSYKNIRNVFALF